MEKLYIKFLIVLAMSFLVYNGSLFAQNKNVNTCVNELKQIQMQPNKLITDVLQKYDLVIFDDGIHSAKEPFDFYCQLINDTSMSNKVSYIFLEAFNTSSQIHLDAFFNSKTPDSLLLIKAFQDDYSGYGWRYQTYLDLFNCIWKVNNSKIKKLKVIAVSPPIFWEGLKTNQDYETFQNSLSSRDYFMYQTIKSAMSDFKNGVKGFFLTNTRHAYKNVKDSTGQLYWNTNTFFNQSNPGKTYSIRIHNASISITQKRKDAGKITTEGLNEFDYKWVLPENGLWDSAFAKHNKFPLAISLTNNCFGNSKYVGNLMINVKQGTTHMDAYDAIIVLKPHQEWSFSATFGYIYTPEFRAEIKRRIRVMQEGDIEQFLKENKVKSLDELIDLIATPSSSQKNTLIK